MATSERINDMATAKSVTGFLADGDPSSPPPSDAPAIPGYIIERSLGEGASGIVYAGVRDGLGQPVAIKIHRLRLGEDAKGSRAWRELDVLSHLQLPCLPRVHNFGDVDGRFYIVTDLIEGFTLLEHCEKNNLSRRERVELLAKTAEAVHSLHEHGVIHRDIKPSNIIINAHDQPMIIDLGIALLVTTNVYDTLTADGMSLGTPACMSPEQARGDRDEISTRSDIYGLGATAFLVLTGLSPYELNGTLHEMLVRIGSDDPRAARELDATLPKPLAAVLNKAVARNPSDRYASAADFAEDLRRWLRGDPVEAGEQSALRRLGRIIRRYPIKTTLGVSSGMIAMSLLLTFVLIQYLLTKPSHIQYSADRKTAQLVSAGGAIIKQWSCKSGDARWQISELINSPNTFGSKRFVAVAFRDEEQSPFRGKLCVFDVDKSLDTPSWTASVSDSELPDSLSGLDWNYQGEQFFAQRVFALNVLDDDPAPKQILVVFAHTPRSPRVVRVYSLEGELLFQFWHDGALSAPVFLPKHQTLIFAGDNKEALWSDRGEAIEQYPTVICLAVRPQLGNIGSEFLPSSPTHSDEATVALWYKALYPPKAAVQFGAPLLHVSPYRSTHEDYCLISIATRDSISTEREAIEYMIRYDGELDVESVVPSEPYQVRLHRGEVPNPLDLYFKDLPAISSRSSDSLSKQNK